MNNKEIKNPIPPELDDNELGEVSGGESIMSSPIWPEDVLPVGAITET